MNAEELAVKMTAEELAVKMEMGNYDWADEAATMLRQQQAEIEALKADTIPYRDLHQVVKNVLAQPMRELTDGEIESAYWSLVGKQHEGKIASYLYNFARDILKKASEK